MLLPPYFFFLDLAFFCIKNTAKHYSGFVQGCFKMWIWAWVLRFHKESKLLSFFFFIATYLKIVSRDQISNDLDRCFGCNTTRMYLEWGKHLFFFYKPINSLNWKALLLGKVTNLSTFIINSDIVHNSKFFIFCSNIL